MIQIIVGVLVFLVLGAVGHWLISYVRDRKHETTVRALKKTVKQQIQETCEAAKRGDPCAALRLEALQETLESQSVRLTGHPKPPTTRIQPGGLKVLLLISTAFLIPACATEKDALLNNQNEKAGEYVEAHSVQPDVKQAGRDIKDNSRVLAKNALGEAPVEQQKPYTPENSKAAREDSNKSHTSGVWPWITGALGVLLPFAIGVAMLHPWGAVVARLAEPYIEKLVAVHNQAEDAPNDLIHRDEIVGHIDDLLSNTKTGPVVAKLITKIGIEQGQPVA